MIKYRSPTRPLFITVKTEKVDNDFILMEVQYIGLGIEQKSKDKIFGMYQRLHTNIPGTGVGLGIVDKIIKISGAKIELEIEKKEEGKNFKIYLPSEM